MRYKVWCFTVLFSLLVSVNCTETFTETGLITLVAQISVDSEFISQGYFLVGDTVQFTGSVTSEESGQTIPSSGLRFTSSDPSVVEINANTGRAVFKSIGGPVEVRVTFAEPQLQGTTDTLEARMNVTVTQFDVALSLTSTATGLEVDTLAALERDTVEVSADVFYEGELVTSVDPGDILIASSSDTDVIDPSVPAAANRAALAGAGQATLTVELGQPDIPGSDPLTATVGVNVESFLIELSVESQVVGSNHLANGDTLVTDAVQFSGVVITAGTNTTPISGATWTSTDPAVNITDASAGLAEFEAVGTAVVRVAFTDPVVPVQTDSLVVRVTTLVPSMTLESQYTAGVTDTLVTDSVWAIPSVTKDGQVQGGVQLLETESTDSSVIAIRDGPAGVLVFADTGLASIIMTVDQPDLPRAKIADTVDVEVGTFVVEISGPGTTPIMGDTIDYDVTVTDTRGDTALTNVDVTFTSSDVGVIRYLDAATGLALARDVGTATVGVQLDVPALPDPDSTLTDALTPTTISVERFYGEFSMLSGDFGDTVTVYASEVHTFTDSTRIAFANGTVLFVDSVWTDSVWAVIGAATDTSLLTLDNLLNDGMPDHDNVLSRATFTGPDVVEDPFEPNDTFPLTSADSIGIGFEAVLSIDPTKSDPIDNDFFWYIIQSGAPQQTVTVEWQQIANLNFRICAAIGQPPTDVDPAFCPVLEGVDSSTTGPETGSDSFGPGRFVLRVWCNDTCGTEPITYKLTFTSP